MIDESVLRVKLEVEKLSIRQIAASLGLSYTTVRYWMKKYDLSPSCKSAAVEGGKKRCATCGVWKMEECFYPRKTRKSRCADCKVCSNRKAVDRQRQYKRLCVEYKGGKCMDCGLMSPVLDLYEFHPERLHNLVLDQEISD